MESTYGMIISKWGDYKECKDCGGMNWYENEICTHCSSHPSKFKNMTQKMSDNLEKEINDWNIEYNNPDEDSDAHWCFDCIIEI